MRISDCAVRQVFFQRSSAEPHRSITCRNRTQGMRIDIPIHVQNRHLFEAAAGRLKLKEWEQQHVHACEVCQGVFYVFISQPLNPPKNPQEPPPTA